MQQQQGEYESSERNTISGSVTQSSSGSELSSSMDASYNSDSGCDVSKLKSCVGQSSGINKRANRPNPFTNNNTEVDTFSKTLDMSDLDVTLPSLDFDKLEKSLAASATCSKMNRNTSYEDEYSPNTFYPPAPTRRPLRSNLGKRLQSGMNLQLCYVNDAQLEDERTAHTKDVMSPEYDSSDDEDSYNGNSDSMVLKSKSTPNLAERGNLQRIGRSKSNASQKTESSDDCFKKASELKQANLAQLGRLKDPVARRAFLEQETKQLLEKARQAAHMQMELEKEQAKLNVTTPPNIPLIQGTILGSGIFTGKRQRFNRVQLMKMSVCELQILANHLLNVIEEQNEHLVTFLQEKDRLHMEQDSILVDIEDEIIKSIDCAGPIN